MPFIRLNLRPLQVAESLKAIATFINRELRPLLIEIRGKLNGRHGSVVTITESATQGIEDEVVYVDTTDGNVTYTLLPQAQWSMLLFIIKTSSDANTVTIAAADGEEITGAATTLSSQWAWSLLTSTDSS